MRKGAVGMTFVLAALAALLTGQAQVIRDAEMGISFTAPAGWKAQKQGNAFWLGSDNLKGFILIMEHSYSTLDQMQEEASQGIMDEASGIELIPSSVSEPFQINGLAAEFRGRKALVSPNVLAEVLLRFRDLAAAFSPFSGDSPFVIEEAEVNPFVVRRGRLIPLDGVCRFSRAKLSVPSRPAAAIGRLLRPESIGIIGVSEKMNIGHIILNNTLARGFPPEGVTVVKPGLDRIEGCLAVPSVASMPRPVDLSVLTLAADQWYGVMKDLVDHEKARSVIQIDGGMGEKEGGASIEEKIRSLLFEDRRSGKITPVVNGGNCLGILSEPGRYSTFFIPAHKLPELPLDSALSIRFVQGYVKPPSDPAGAPDWTRVTRIRFIKIGEHK